MFYTIGEMAQRLNVAPSTLRYYDKEGLLPFLERSSGGMRMFKDEDVEWLQMLGCLKKAGMPLREIKSFMELSRQGDATIGQRLEMIEQRRFDLLRRFLAERLEPATAVICYNDEIAFLLIQELLAMGKKVPQDVAVVSFDNSYYSQISPIPITSLRHREKMGRTAAEEMIRILGGAPGQSRALEWELLERSSS